MSNINRRTSPLWDLSTVYVFDDFTGDQTDLYFVDTITDSGTVTMGDEVNGVVTLTPSDGSVADNDEAYLASANELFKFGTNRAIYGECRLQFAETSAGVGNVAFGFQNAVGADSIIDDGGTNVVKTSGSTLAICKKDTESVWTCVSACNGTATLTKSSKAAVAATWYTLQIVCGDWDGTSMQVSYKVDDGNGAEYLVDTNGNKILHTVAIASATEMQVWVGRKLGAATNNDTLKADYIYASQTRV